MTDIKAIEPTEIISGDTVEWTIADGDRPAPTWVLTYSLVRAGCDKIVLTAADNGDGSHLISELAATTSNWDAGEYHWQRHFTSGAVRETRGSGWILVKADYASTTADPRSHVKRTLDALEAVRENKASGDQLSMSIQGRSVSRMNWDEINSAYDHFKRLFDAEVSAEKSKRGIPDKSSRIKVQFDNA